MKSKLPQIKYSTMHLTALQQLKNIAVRLLAYTSILFLCSFALAMPATAQITINEVMQANLHLKDDQNNLPESWIELFNNTDNAINLKNHYLRQGEHAYRFNTDMLVPAQAYQIIYCDEQDTANHTNFKLKHNKAARLSLLSPDSIVIDEVIIPKMAQPGISFGNDGNEPGTWGWTIGATPGLRNTATGEILPPPSLQESSGYYSSPLTIHLEKYAESDVRYTTDGSEPTEESELMSGELQITQSTVIRLRAFADGHVPSPTVTYSFLFLEREATLPVFSIVVPPDDLYDEQYGIMANGNYSEGTPNYLFDWRRAAHVDYFDTDNTQLLNQLCEIRIAGGNSRAFPQKSLVLYSTKRLSGDDFVCTFWHEKPNITSVHSIMLRNAGNDFLLCHLRDAAAQSIAGAYLDVDYQAYEPAIVYINGKYYGLMNIRERSNEDYIESNYGLTDTDIIENWWQAKEGTIDDAAELYEWILSDTASYEALEQKADVPELLNYIITEAYFGNIDFIDNNMLMWKPDGGKWRWMLHDLDMTFNYHFRRNNPEHPVINHFECFYAPHPTMGELGENGMYTSFFRKILHFAPFKEQLVDRFTVYMGDFLHHRRLTPYIDSLAQRIAAEIPYTEDLYASFMENEPTDWEQEVNIMKSFLTERQWLNAYALMQFYGLGDMYKLAINDIENENSAYSLVLNGIAMKHPSFDGFYYKDRALSVRAIPNDTNTQPADGWLIEKTLNGNVYREYRSGDTLIFTLPQHSPIESVKITPCKEKPENMAAENSVQWHITKGGVYITQLQEADEVIITDILGKTVYRKQPKAENELYIALHPGCYVLRIGREKAKILIE